MIGQTLGHYRILEQIGAGGMGVVYRAHDQRLDRDVAVKVLPPGTLADEAGRKRFRREALTLSKLNHPNIETIFDFDTQDGVDFLVMELIPGNALDQKLLVGALSEKEVLRLGQQLAEGLAAAHAEGVIHRDLKPGNLHITADGRLKILDFGLARLLQPISDAGVTESLTETQAVTGTLPYMAPEQLRGEKVDARSDIWAAGAVLYEMAAGQRPFGAKLASALSADIQHKPSLPPRQLNPKISLRLEEIILKCLEKEAENRYQSAKELHVDLRRLASPAVAAPASRARRGRGLYAWGALGSVGILFAAVLWLNVGRIREGLFGAPRPVLIESLAVLPLANLSGQPEQEYFADGMTEELITDLAKIRALKVISRTSAMQYKGVRKPLPLIARELGVDGVIEGSVLREGDQVRITVQLIQGKTDQHLWANSYHRELRGVLALQGEVAQAIADEIKVQLTPQELARLTAARAVNPEAYQLYLKGNFQLLKSNEEGFRRAIEYFEQAIERDSTYASAYAGLSMAYAEMGSWFGSLSQEDVRSKAKEAAMRAVQLDDRLAEAHFALGQVKRYFAWDWPGTESEFTRGMELNANSSWARMNFANHLTAMGRFEESIAAGKQTLEIDPLSPAVYNELGWALKHAGRYQAALEQYRKGLELDPDFEQSRWVLGELYLETGRYQEALSETDKLVGLAPGKDSMSWAANVYARVGRRAEARRILNELKERAKQEYVSPVAFARIFAGLGETEQALNLLEKAFADRDVRLVMLKVESAWAPLRSNPRFQDLLRRMNFPF